MGKTMKLTTAATVSIDNLMKWLTLHEFINIQAEWGPEVPLYDNKITRLTQLINQTNQYLDPEDDDKFSDGFASLTKNIVQLSQ
jgi:hypothetical protein